MSPTEARTEPSPTQERNLVPTAREPRAAGAGPSSLANAAQTFYARRGARALSLFVLLLGAPLAMVVGACVALANLLVFGTPRKILFIQERAGHHGRTFRLVKFRTMRDASDHFASWSGGDQARVTSLGRFLRNAHLDELPQLWNVLLGDMNLVGPRPEMLEIEAWAAQSVPGFSRRLAVPPGLTGLAQITQGYTTRDVEAYAEKLAICEHYIARRCLLFDLRVMLLTGIWMLRRRGWDWNKSDGSTAVEPPSQELEPRHPASCDRSRAA